jgi:hypothetical protein
MLPAVRPTNMVAVVTTRLVVPAAFRLHHEIKRGSIEGRGEVCISHGMRGWEAHWTYG